MRAKLTKRTVDAAEVQKRDSFVWDTEVRGFGLKVTSCGRKVYVLQRRLKGRLRRWTIGVHGSPWTPEMARNEASELLRAVTRGLDPLAAKRAANNAVTVSELCDLYLREGCSTKKASTVAVDHGRIERHIKPLLGKRTLDGLDRKDVERFMVDVAAGRDSYRCAHQVPWQIEGDRRQGYCHADDGAAWRHPEFRSRPRSSH
jgi:hypothetical protein